MSKDFGPNGPPQIVTNNAITVVLDGDSRTVKADTPEYNKAIKCIKEMDWDALEQVMKPEIAIEEQSDGRFRVEEGQVYVTLEDDTEFALPTGLNDTVLTYMDKELNFDRLIKFAIKLADNPSRSSVQQLFNFIKNTNLTITEDGDFIGYKSVNADFTDRYSGKFDNSPGKVVKMPRREIDENPEVTCSYGLHVATYDYAHNIYQGDVTVFCAVNPRDVVSCPTDYKRSKLRCCQYTVLGVSEGEFKSPAYDVLSEKEVAFAGSDHTHCTSSQSDDDSDYDDEEELDSNKEKHICENCGEYYHKCFCDEDDEEDPPCSWCGEAMDDCTCGLSDKFLT